MNSSAQEDCQAFAGIQFDELEDTLNQKDFHHLKSTQVIELLSRISGSRIGNDQLFLDSWNTLEEDQYMADSGRYRKRRHATFETRSADEPPALMPYQPHYQKLDYNPLNGGVARYFAPILVDLLNSRTLGQKGNPTPEGVHRDGVDFVIVVMIKRVNIESGATSIYSLENALLGEFTLLETFDMAIVNDRKVYHGVTPIIQLDPEQEAYRDVLVMTFKQKK